jgi:hypothetical protein
MLSGFTDDSVSFGPLGEAGGDALEVLGVGFPGVPRRAIGRPGLNTQHRRERTTGKSRRGDRRAVSANVA